MKIKRNMRVRVISTNYTKNTHGINQDMKRMVKQKKEFRVQSVFKNDMGGQSCNMGAWSWDCRDIRPFGDSQFECPKPERFDIKNLVMEE